jgi:hypothetical protein
VDIDAYTYPGQDIGAAAEQDIAYVKEPARQGGLDQLPVLHERGLANGVHASPATPSPAQLAVIVEDAQEAGLFVSNRPLLDETNLGGGTDPVPAGCPGAPVRQLPETPAALPGDGASTPVCPRCTSASSSAFPKSLY